MFLFIILHLNSSPSFFVPTHAQTFFRGVGKTHRELNPFFLPARAQCEFGRHAHAYLLRKQWRFEYFEAGKYQTLEEYFPQLCTCFAWGATDSDKVSFYLYSCENYVVPRGVQRIASLDAHPTAYYDVFFQTS
jgi:hypothetical protein